MGHIKDRTGLCIGGATVIGLASKQPGDAHAYWRLRCICGREFTRSSTMLGAVRAARRPITCGCIRDKVAKQLSAMRTIDLTGLRFGRLTVVGQVERPAHVTGKNRAAWWRCVCDCGRSHVVTATSMKCGATRSCGCLRMEQLKQRGSLIPVRRYLNTYVRAALGRGLAWELSVEQFEALIKRPCTYCGEPPSKPIKARAHVELFNGIDRRDNSRGYTPDNVGACCEQCNKAKRRMSAKEFLAWVTKVYNFNRTNDL